MRSGPFTFAMFKFTEDEGPRRRDVHHPQPCSSGRALRPGRLTSLPRLHTHVTLFVLPAPSQALFCGTTYAECWGTESLSSGSYKGPERPRLTEVQVRGTRCPQEP